MYMCMCTGTTHTCSVYVYRILVLLYFMGIMYLFTSILFRVDIYILTLQLAAEESLNEVRRELADMTQQK